MATTATMDGARLANALATLRWTNRTIAHDLGCNEKLVRRWIADEIAIPEPVADWVAACERVARSVRFPPPPKGWRSNLHYDPAHNPRTLRRKASAA